MQIKDKVCFHNIDRENAKKIINIIGKERYDFLYSSDYNKLKMIFEEENINLIITYDDLEEKEMSKIKAFSESNYISLLIINENKSQIYNHTTIERAEYLMYLVKTLCRLSWVSRINEKRMKNGDENYKDSYLRIIDLLDELDAHSKGHSEKVQKYAKELGKAMNLKRDDLKKLNTAAVLHDIGKTVIPKEILTNPNKLSTDEFDIIKLHTSMVELVMHDEFKDILPIIKSHHEKYDGSGYPRGLAGDKIPLMARILTVIDSYDAMTSKRIYNTPVSDSKAIEILKNDSGTHFDPEIVEKFIEILEKN